MTHEFSRRNVLKLSVAAAAAGAFSGAAPRSARAIDFEGPVPEAKNLTTCLDKGQVMVRWNNMPLTTYRAYPTLKYPYFYPINGPVSCSSLTSESGVPYPHHRSLWLGLQQARWGDYWGPTPLSTGQIKSVELKLGEATETSAVILDRCEWIWEGNPSPFLDERKITISVENENLWFIDTEFKLTAQSDVEVGTAKHSFFAMRAASDISPLYGGVIMNSEGGINAEGTYEKPAKWCGYHGKRYGRPDIVEGIAIMDHPGNPWASSPWFTRDYGHLSAPAFHFRSEPWRLPKGQSVQMKYRVALHAGNPKEAGLDGVYRKWIA